MKSKKKSIILHTYYNWWYLVFFTAPVMGSVLDLDMNSYRDIYHFDRIKERKKNTFILSADMLQKN